MENKLLLVLLLFPFCSIAHEGESRPDSHAPIGLMGDHSHLTGEFMFGYRHMHMEASEIRQGDDIISTAQALNTYMMTPTKMVMDMDMFGFMYGVTDHLTMSIGLPYISKKMTMQNRMGVTSSMQTEGIGDAKLTAIYRAYTTDTAKLHIQGIASFPTGEIDERNAMGNRLGYGMQLGSGTYDFGLKTTYNNLLDNWSYGWQASALIRTGENDNGYRLGNKYDASIWGSYRVADDASVSLRLNAERWDDISGSDSSLNPMMSPGNSTDNGGERISLHAGVNLLEYGNQRLAIEFGIPLYERYDGIALSRDYAITIGWQANY